jgi:ABC-type glycerol-3-phosphate transport system substrate-binding protein
MEIPGLFLLLAMMALVMAVLVRFLSSSTGARAATRKAVVRRVNAEYPGEAERVLSELDLYSGREPDRVKMDILLLSAGSLEDLKRWTRMASNDYRDVLTAAEHADSEMGVRILRTFRERRPDNSINLSWKDLLDEDPSEGEPLHGQIQ